MPNPEFYKRMLEAKAAKKKRLEQEQLAAEFQVHPERFQPAVMKPENEIKMDKAFSELRDKIRAESVRESPMDRAIRHLEEKSKGL